MSQEDLPTTVESAVRILRLVIPDDEQSAIAAVPEDDLIDLHLGLGLCPMDRIEQTDCFPGRPVLIRRKNNARRMFNGPSAS